MMPNVLFSTKCDLFHNFIVFCSNNTFFITHVLKSKYPLHWTKGKTVQEL